MSKAHIPLAVAIRGCNTFREKDKIVKDFIILNQVVSEKTLMKHVHMCYIRVTEGKIENLKKEGWLVGFVALRPKSTPMVIAGRSVHLTTLFPGQA